jgi:DNA-binding PadR family transcriptional regulator
MEILTRVEEAILLAVVRLGENAYGVTIRKEVEEMIGKSYSVGAIYVPLDRMAKRHLLATTMGKPTPERGGRSKRYYHLTAGGLQALQEAKQMHDAMWAETPNLGLLG